MNAVQPTDQQAQAAPDSRKWWIARIVASLALLVAASLIFIPPQFGFKIKAPWHILLWIVLACSALTIGATLTRAASHGSQSP